MAISSFFLIPPKAPRHWPIAAHCAALPSCIKCHITPLFPVPWRPRRASAPIWAGTLRSAPCRVIFPKANRWPGPARQLIGIEALVTGTRHPWGCFVSVFVRGRRRGPHEVEGRRAMMEKVPMTAGGYAALEVELKQRQSVERPRIIEHIAEARSHGDLSENAEYDPAKEGQWHNQGRIAQLEDKLARADIIDISKLSGDTVKFGAPSPWWPKHPRKKRWGRR